MLLTFLGVVMKLFLLKNENEMKMKNLGAFSAIITFWHRDSWAITPTSVEAHKYYKESSQWNELN